jgi:hypothetical protein
MDLCPLSDPEQARARANELTARLHAWHTELSVAA